jgi:hypothetical protein
MGYLIDILIGAASRIVTAELSAYAEPMARWMIDKAVERVPADYRDRFREEWLADLNDTPGMLRKLWHAAGCRIGAGKLATVLLAEKQRDVENSIKELMSLTDRMLNLANRHPAAFNAMAKGQCGDLLRRATVASIRETDKIFAVLLKLCCT